MTTKHRGRGGERERDSTETTRTAKQTDGQQTDRHDSFFVATPKRHSQRERERERERERGLKLFDFFFLCFFFSEPKPKQLRHSRKRKNSRGKKKSGI